MIKLRQMRYCCPLNEKFQCVPFGDSVAEIACGCGSFKLALRRSAGYGGARVGEVELSL